MADAAPDTPPRHLRMHGVQIFIADAARSRAFYVDTLGFTLAFEVEVTPTRRSMGVAPPDGTSIIVLVEAGEGTPQVPGSADGIILLTNEIGALCREWSARGVEFIQSPQDVRWGARVAEFKDPDGNRFRLIEPDALTAQLEAERRAADEKRAAERRAVHEMDIAREVQRRLFPQAAPALASLDCASICVPARQVGGDYYDFLDLGDGRVGIALGDVAGKGIAAALLMANLQANVRGQLTRAGGDLAALIESVNHQFVANGSGASYATFFVAAYDEAARRLQYVNCGHLPPLVLRAAGHVDRLNPTSSVLGFFDPLRCGAAEVAFAPGDTLLVYTDGVTEARNADGDEFGEARLVDLLTRRRWTSAADLVDAAVSTVNTFRHGEPEDDVTVLALRVE